MMNLLEVELILMSLAFEANALYIIMKFYLYQKAVDKLKQTQIKIQLKQIISEISPQQQNLSDFHLSNYFIIASKRIYHFYYQNMSKYSPYRKQPKRDHSPNYIPPIDNSSRLVQKSRPGRSIIAEQTHQKKIFTSYEEQSSPYFKATEKKKMEDLSREGLLDKNTFLSSENVELYAMLEERGRIIVALQKKLQAQINREVQTLEEIQYEKNLFIAESNRKLKNYEDQIQNLLNEIYVLNEQNTKNNHAKHREIDTFRDTLSREHMMQLQMVAHNQASARQIAEAERAKTKNVIDIKNNEIEELNIEFRNHIDKLKNQIINLNNQLAHINHMKKIETSELKIHFENVMEGMHREFEKEREVILFQTEVEVKKVHNLLNSKESQALHLGDEIKIAQLQNNVREQELIEKKMKLENEIMALDEFHKHAKFNETQKLKDLNKSELLALEAGNTAFINNLKSENNKLIELNKSKAQQVEELFNQINQLRNQHSNETTDHQKLIENLKSKLLHMQAQVIEAQERFKVKLAELREADLKALKEYYEHQISILAENNDEKDTIIEENRNKIYLELQEKDQLRKHFDIETTKLKSKILELEHRLNAAVLERTQENNKIGTQMEMTSMMLSRESKQKQKYTQFSQEEKKKLQYLIQAKDQEIEQLNSKITFLKEHNFKEIHQKNYELAIIKKSNEDLETELKKEKYFYENQLRKRESTIKNLKESSQQQMERIKKNSREQYDSMMKELSTAKTELQIELNKCFSRQKKLKDEINILHKIKQQEQEENHEQIKHEKARLISEKKDQEEELKMYYEEEIKKLNIEIEDCKEQLKHKEEEIRSANEKYHKLEKKLESIMESQEKLKHMESKIMALGAENNLVKNMADIIRSRKK